MAIRTLFAVLLMAAAITLRGRLPGAEQTPHAEATASPAAMVAVVVLLLCSVGIVAVAVVVRARNRGAVSTGVASRPDWLRRDVGRPSWRTTLIVFAVVVTWLLIAALLSRLGGGTAAPVFAPGGHPAAPSATPAAPAPGAKTPVPQQDSPLIGYFYAATLAFLVVLVVGTIVTSRRTRRVTASALEPAPHAPIAASAVDQEALVRAAEVGLAEVEDPSRDPRKAIIACYAAMERELARVPGVAPQDFDTASEVLARAVEYHALGPDNATQLVDLFDEARFSPHVMNEGHRETAVEVLQRVLAELAAVASPS